MLLVINQEVYLNNYAKAPQEIPYLFKVLDMLSIRINHS